MNTRPDPHTAVLLDASLRTSFLYRIEGGMDERDLDEFEAMDSGYVLGSNWPPAVSDSMDLRHRMGYVKKRNLGFGFIGICDESFGLDLSSVDADLPVTLAYMVSDAYRDGTQRVSDLVDNVRCRNPVGLKKPSETDAYRKMTVSYLRTLTDIDCSDDVLLDNCFFERIPANKFECTSISGNKSDGYKIRLVLKIVYRSGLRA